MNVRLTKAQKIKILNSAAIYKIMQQVLLRENKIRRNQEHFWVVGLDNNNKILFVELVALGRVNRVDANPPDVFRMGIYKLAVKMILVHNHPSGDLKPSIQDEVFTDRMYHVGKFINIEVIDHLIISETDYYSFADKGVMKRVKRSKRFNLDEEETLEIEKWKLKMELERAAKKRDLVIGKKMKADGVDVDTIMKYTDLTPQEISKL